MNPLRWSQTVITLGNILNDINQGLNYKSRHETAEIHQPVPYC